MIRFQIQDDKKLVLDNNSKKKNKNVDIRHRRPRPLEQNGQLLEKLAILF